MIVPIDTPASAAVEVEAALQLCACDVYAVTAQNGFNPSCNGVMVRFVIWLHCRYEEVWISAKWSHRYFPRKCCMSVWSHFVNVLDGRFEVLFDYPHSVPVSLSYA